MEQRLSGGKGSPKRPSAGSVEILAKPQPTIAKISRPFLTHAQLDVVKHESGMSGLVGLTRRVEAFFLLWAVCRQVKLPTRVFATAMLFVQRVMLANRLKDVTLLVIAGSCLMSAYKIEDMPKKSADIAAALLRVSGDSSRGVDDLTTQMLDFERHVLETICFDFRIEHVHSYVIKMGHSLKVPQKVASLAWAVATDAYCTDVVLKYPTHTVALATLVIATKSYDYALASIDVERMATDRRDVNDSIVELLDFYLAPLVPSPRPLHAVRAINLERMAPFRDEAAQELMELGGVTNVKSQGFEGLGIRDRNLSQEGTARFILDYERDHIEGETIA